MLLCIASGKVCEFVYDGTREEWNRGIVVDVMSNKLYIELSVARMTWIYN